MAPASPLEKFFNGPKSGAMQTITSTPRRRGALAAVAGAAAAAVALSASAAPPRLEAAQPWSRPAAAGTTGVGFMTLINRGRSAEVLTAVETPAARKVEIHRSSMKGDMASMQRQEGVSIPAGGAVRFEPGGLHLMLIGLTRPLKTGDKAPAVLVFASGARIKADFAVGTTPPKAAEHGHH